MIKYACDEHINDAMEDMINESESFPIISENKDKECTYCSEKSKYEIRFEQ